MLVEPHLRRDDHAAGSPVDPMDRLTLLPHQGTVPEDEDVNAGAVPVRLLVGAHRPAGAVRAHGAVHHVEPRAESADRPVPALALDVLPSVARLHHVGHEVRRPGPRPLETWGDSLK